MKSRKSTIEVQGAAITVLSSDDSDFICLTDVAKCKNPDHPDDVIRNWLRNRNTVEFLGVWERLNSFTLTPKQWIEKTGAIGITSQAGRCGIHTDAIKAHLIPPQITPAQAAFTYATEADLLNVALFGQTAKQWRDANPKADGNVRDHATIEQLLVLANIEGMNAEFQIWPRPVAQERPSRHHQDQLERPRATL